MALPKLNTINYEMDLPSNGEKIKYRPFLVKEQKNLLIAQETEDPKIIESALADIVKDCTFGLIDPYKSPLFDIEYVFLKVRGKSVGEKVTLNLLCPDDGKTRVETEIDLSEVNVQMNVEHTNIIKITDSISVVMSYPTLSSMNDFNDDLKDWHTKNGGGMDITIRVHKTLILNECILKVYNNNNKK